MDLNDYCRHTLGAKGRVCILDRMENLNLKI